VLGCVGLGWVDLRMDSSHGGPGITNQKQTVAGFCGENDQNLSILLVGERVKHGVIEDFQIRDGSFDYK
jgi:hypothetical protein